jgi:hypothetical protein
VAIPFVPGYDDIAGKVIKLDHITNQSRGLSMTFPITIFFRVC